MNNNTLESVKLVLRMIQASVAQARNAHPDHPMLICVHGVISGMLDEDHDTVLAAARRYTERMSSTKTVSELSRED